jgi:hypothetical protein
VPPHGRCSERRILLKPAFQDFDRKSVTKTISKFCHNVGFVTRAQFRQALGVIFPQVCSAQHSTAPTRACLLGARLTAALDSDSADLQVRFEEVHFEVLFGKLADGGDVNYLLFCALVDPEVSVRTAWRHALLRHAVACATAVPMNLVEAARLALPAHHRPISSACVLCWIDHMRHNMVHLKIVSYEPVGCCSPQRGSAARKLGVHVPKDAILSATVIWRLSAEPMSNC